MLNKSVVIREGFPKKGGLNPGPTDYKPPAPKSFRLIPAVDRESYIKGSKKMPDSYKTERDTMNSGGDKILSVSVFRVAIRLAEKSVNEIMEQLRETEKSRDRLVRELGFMQQKIDNLYSEKDYRSRHLRNLLGNSDGETLIAESAPS